MQAQSSGSMTLVGGDVPFPWGASSGNGNGHRTATAMAAATLWTDELAIPENAQQTDAQSIMMLVHELRAPAAASKSMVATLRYLDPHDAPFDNFLTRIEKRMDQLLELVDDILDLSQAKSARPLGQAATLDLVAETRIVCGPYQEDAATKGLAMSVELPESSVRVHMPEKAYHLILSNLISNAVKYTPAGSVRVILRKEGLWAILEVQDTGIGIPAVEVRHLCTEFFRASNARRSPAPGTGLGLAAVKALLQEYQGELELQSGENRGSSFVVRLPLFRTNAVHSPGSVARS